MIVDVCVITTDPDKVMLECRHRKQVDFPMLGPVQRMQEMYEKYKICLTKPDWLVFIHDDVTVDLVKPNIYFSSFPSNCAVIGLGGATGIGVPDIYKTPYHINQLIRQNYCSNQTDWSVHGSHFTGTKKVAVIDGFFMAIRWKFLEEIGGFDWMKTRFHCYDTALCLEAYRRGWEVWMTGLECTHHGGGTSTKKEYVDWCTEQGTTPEREHAEPHVWLYDRYRDLLPFHV